MCSILRVQRLDSDLTIQCQTFESCLEFGSRPSKIVTDHIHVTEGEEDLGDDMKLLRKSPVDELLRRMMHRIYCPCCELECSWRVSS